MKILFRMNYRIFGNYKLKSSKFSGYSLVLREQWYFWISRIPSFRNRVGFWTFWSWKFDFLFHWWSWRQKCFCLFFCLSICFCLQLSLPSCLLRLLQQLQKRVLKLKPRFSKLSNLLHGEMDQSKERYGYDLGSRLKMIQKSRSKFRISGISGGLHL